MRRLVGVSTHCHGLSGGNQRLSLSKGNQQEEKKETRENQTCRLSPEGGRAFHDAAVSERLQEKREKEKEVKRYWLFHEKFISEREERRHWRVGIHEAEGRERKP